jgi:hypothetical protein
MRVEVMNVRRVEDAIRNRRGLQEFLRVHLSGCGPERPPRAHCLRKRGECRACDAEGTARGRSRQRGKKGREMIAQPEPQRHVRN